jgi:hypothetical protein
VQIERDIKKAKNKNPSMADKEILKLLADENIENTNDYRQLEFRKTSSKISTPALAKTSSSISLMSDFRDFRSIAKRSFCMSSK